MEANPSAPAFPPTVTPTCVVTLRSDGLQLQHVRYAPFMGLDRPGLELLAALSEGRTRLDPLIEEVAAQTGASFDDLRTFVGALRFTKRVDRIPAWTQPEVPERPDLHDPASFDVDRPGRVGLRLPLTPRLRAGRFELIDHDGRLAAALSAAELDALGGLITPVPVDRVHDVLGARSGLDRAEIDLLLSRVERAGLLWVDGSAPAAPKVEVDREAEVRRAFDRHAAAQDEAEQQREASTGRRRPKVIPVAFDVGAPAGLGQVVATAKAHDGGRLDDFYQFRTDWVWSDARLDEFTREPAIYLFSDYLWSHARCIEVSRQVKERSPASITIHGGPDAPKYERDAEEYFAAHPHVDVVVRGEGEISAAETLSALTAVIGQPEPDLSVLAGIEGITYRDGDRVIRNPERDRVEDINTLPSAFLTGLFDVFAGLPELFVTLETNRGCPYSCTFCDWGSATNSRIRKFDLERVNAELEWCSQAEVVSVSVADANFGIFARDVEIAQKVADLRSSRGHPRAFGVSFAKNTVKHLQHIITVLAEAGIMAQGVLSLQSMDEGTLNTIRRSNIKTEKYDQLADEMRRSQLPLAVELMMGLPGMTVASFKEDLQQCIDREVPCRVNQTQLLVNSPMNDPEYLAANQIETSQPLGPGSHAMVVSTSSFTEEDYREMERLRVTNLVLEIFGVLRLVSRFVRQETGMREIDFYQRLRQAAQDEPTRWPSLAAQVIYGGEMMAPPYSWALLLADVRDLLVSELGVAADDALDSVLEAQRAILPDHGRAFPQRLALAHDVAGWSRAIMTAKGHGHRSDWPDHVGRLADYGPGDLVVEDPEGVCETSLGCPSEMNNIGMNWELESPLSRAHVQATITWAEAENALVPKDVDSTIGIPVKLG